MITRTLKIIGCVLVLNSLVFGFQAGDWTRYSSAGGRFSVLIPTTEQPTEQVETKPDESGPYTTHTFAIRVPDKGAYMVAWVEYAPSMRLNVQGELAANRDNLLKPFKGTVLSQTTISLEGNPGIEFTADVEVNGAPAYVKSRVYVVGSRPYMLAALFFKGQEDYRGIDKFLTSLELTKTSGSGHAP